MARGVRDRMIASTALLLAERGLAGTSFRDVLVRARAPRGSVYHHFPLGKDSLVSEAIDLVNVRSLGVLQARAGEPADTVVELYLGLWRGLLERTAYGAGCAVLAVTVGTDSEALLDQTAAIFRTWSEVIAALLVEGGVAADEADALATVVIAASEGAVVLSRAQRDIRPFDQVAEHLLAHTRALMRP